jgi:tetratricopeptide (TPR) repeat protein
MRSLLLPTLLALPLSAFLAAQDKPAPVRLTPLRVSPASTVSQEIGISKIDLAFARPAVKGRKIWGDLVPYGQVWRAGANNATVITLSHAAKVAGKDVPAGSYGFFVIPGEKTWTLILNKKAKQWGAYEYKKEEDLLRWEATPQAGPFLEYLDYRVVPTGTDSATIELGWEKLRVRFPVAFDTRAIYWAHLEDTLKKAPETDWVPWFQAARYCQEQAIEPQKAVAWVEKSLKISETFQNHEAAARIYKDARRMPEALTHLQKAIDLSKGKAPKEYMENLEKELAAWKGQK